jgi:hypothetical protein
MFYFGTIITVRIIMIISAQIITKMGTYSQIQTCGEIAFKLPAALVAMPNFHKILALSWG